MSFQTKLSRTVPMCTNIRIQDGFIQAPEVLIRVLSERRDPVHFVVTDEVVEALHGRKFLARLSSQGAKVKLVIVPVGEVAKSVESFLALIKELFLGGVTSDSIIVSLGGGAVNNVAGFAASALYRGVPLIHVPTTLMAQLDATIDFKQALNTEFGKNSLGSFYAASDVFIDPIVLKTLGSRHLANGLGEPIKHALVYDAELFAMFHGSRNRGLGALDDSEFLRSIIEREIVIKIRVLQDSPTAKSREMITQYGHTIGHAIEHLSGHAILHGEAIAIGMAVTSEIALQRGVCNESVVEAHHDILNDFDLPTRIPNHMDCEAIVACVKHDRHFRNGRAELSLVSDIGCAAAPNQDFVVPIELHEIRSAIASNLKRAV
jgi:3-dehydroquinate synthase